VHSVTAIVPYSRTNHGAVNKGRCLNMGCECTEHRVEATQDVLHDLTAKLWIALNKEMTIAKMSSDLFQENSFFPGHPGHSIVVLPSVLVPVLCLAVVS
jgi:hypothetical protein